MANYDNPEKSSYNEAGYQILRLHDSWVKCNQFRRHGDFNGWKWELDIIFSELYTDIKNRTKKGEEFFKKDKEYRELIAKANKPNTIYNALFERHNFLKTMQDEVGKGGSYQDEGSFLFE